MSQHKLELRMAGEILHDFALLDDTLDLADEERADAHSGSQYHSLSMMFFSHTLFSDQ